MDPSTAWFYAADSQTRTGPVAVETLRALFLSGEIDGLTLVWSPSLGAEWKELCSVAPLKSVLQEAADSDSTDADAEHTVGNDRISPPPSGEQAPAPAAAAPKQYYYADSEGAQSGPVAAEAFSSLLNAGIVSAETLVWTAGMENWRALQSVPQLAGLCGITVVTIGAATSSSLGTSHSSTVAEAADTSAEHAASSAHQGGAKRRRAPDGAAAAAEGKSGTTAGWKRPKENTWIYVVGLPPDATEAEVEAYFRKAGLLQMEIEDGAAGAPLREIPKIRIYRDADGKAKGDASICYLREASVELAVQLLDGANFRPDCPLSVQPATFEKRKGEARKPRKKRKQLTGDSQEVARIKKLEHEVLLSWAEEGDDATGLRIVVLKGLFTPEEMQDEAVQDELAEDVAEEAAALGEIDRLDVFSKHPEGVVVIKYKSPGAAADAISTFHNRWFGGRMIKCEYWDGKTEYRSKESKAEEDKRLDAFGQWLEST